MVITEIKQGTDKKLINGSLPDIDSDFSGKDRDSVKTYMEQRFGESQVCSVGTFTTMRIKGIIKDFARVFGVNFEEANLITSIIDDGDTTLQDLLTRAASEPKLKSFLKKNTDVVHALSKVLDQQKTLSIHPCAMIIFPDTMSARQWSPMRTQKGMLVSEWSGGEMEDAGFLKEDILGITQLSKFTDILALIKKNGKDVPDIYNLPHDSEVYRYFGNGWNGDVFQFGSEGLTGYTKSLKPKAMNDLIAAVSLYRPGPMSPKNLYHEIYVKCKNEGRKPEFLWHTEEITKDTFGLIIYQEQVMKVFQDIGGLSLLEADDVRRAMGKKKLSVLMAWKSRVQKGFKERGATQEEFEKVWGALQEFAKYGFNKSHAAAYAQTGYVGQYLKVKFPLEYWTVALDYASEKDTLRFLAEIAQTKAVSVLPPDINGSKASMSSDMESKNIFWGVESIKGIGEDTALQIISERSKNGKYLSLTDFIERHVFKGSKVKKQTFEALISAGAFDRLYGISDDKIKRFGLIQRFRIYRKVKVAKPERDPYTIGTTEANWWWLLKQKELTGLAFVDYRAIVDEEGMLGQFCSVQESSQHQQRSLFRTFGGYVSECRIGKSTRGKYARLTIEHNYKLFKVVIWSDEYVRFADLLKGCEKSFIVFSGELKYEARYTKGNQFTLTEDSELQILK